jgi:hypothetical protein
LLDSVPAKGRKKAQGGLSSAALLIQRLIPLPEEQQPPPPAESPTPSDGSDNVKRTTPDEEKETEPATELQK